MLGESILDPHGMESDRAGTRGLGLLPIRTTLGDQKTTRVVKAWTASGHLYDAYEIHLGETQFGDAMTPFARLADGAPDGVRMGRIFGTYLHGALEDPLVLAEIGIRVAAPAKNSFGALVNWFEPFAERFQELFLRY